METGLLDITALPPLSEPLAIFDRGSVSAEMAALVARPEFSAQARRREALEILKRSVRAGWQEMRRRFEDPQRPASGGEIMRGNAYLVDELLRALHDYSTQELYPAGSPSTGERLALVAVGGYGRGELAPFSDLDLLFLLPYKMTPRTEQIVEEILYFLWDLGFRVGHATRSVDESIRQAKADHTIRTNLLEARWIWGDQDLYEELRARYAEEIEAGNAADFIEVKLAERDERHRNFGNTRYHLEPNIKEGKGGLRDLNTLFWIAKFVYQVDWVSALVERGVLTGEEARRFDKAQTFLWTLRCHLHYRAGRAEERLTFDLQQVIAPLMGYSDHAGASAVERFMKHYYLVAKDVGDLTRILCAQLELEHKRRPRSPASTLTLRRNQIEGFKVAGERLSVSGPEVFEREPIRMLRIFHVAQTNDMDIHPRALRWIGQNLKRIDKKLREDPAANTLFLEILTAPKNPETALRRMNEAGVLGRFLPDFGRIVAQMQYNMYHHYTVDEHTLVSIGILHRIEQGALGEEVPVASDAVQKIVSRRALYVALLLHDIGKGRGGDHSQRGAKIAQKLSPRLGLSEEETETVVWLIQHHLDMSAVAFKRDVEEPRTIRDFAEVVQSLERLRLLLILTVADIRAVGPNVWNAWKAALLRDLFARTEEELSGGFATEGREQRVAAAKDALRAALSDWRPAEVEAHLKRGYSSYWLSSDLEIQVRHARLIREAECSGRPLTVETRVDAYRGVSEVTVYTADHHGLFSRIAGALAVAGVSIDAARIFTLSNGMALDTFWVRDAQEGPVNRPDRLDRISTSIERVLSGALKPHLELEKRRKAALPSRLAVFKVAPRVLIDNRASADHTLVEVNGRDRRGLLYELTLAIARLGLQIHSAKVSTFGERVVDVFYVQDALGSKIDSKSKQRRIREGLTDVLTPPDQRGAKRAGTRTAGTQAAGMRTVRRGGSRGQARMQRNMAKEGTS